MKTSSLITSVASPANCGFAYPAALRRARPRATAQGSPPRATALIATCVARSASCILCGLILAFCLACSQTEGVPQRDEDASAGSTSTGGTTSAGADTTTGGTTSGNAGAGGSDASPEGSAGASGGMAGAGNETDAGFRCPPGSHLMELNLESLNVEGPLGTLPTDAVNRQNLEGPVWIDDALYTSHFSLTGATESQILKYTPDTGFQIVFPDSGTNGLAVDSNGTLFGARRVNGSVSTFDLDNPSAPPIVVADTYDGLYFRAPNDLVIRSDGTIYFTDPSYEESGNTQSPRQTVERAYWISTGEHRVVHAIDTTPAKPNGIALSPDETVLYIGGFSLMKYLVAADGSVTPDGPFGSGGSDGLTVDCAGNVYAAGSGGVSIFSEGGELLGQVPVPGFATNVAFGGPSRTTLYITRMSPPALYRVELNVVGLPY